LAKNSVTYFMAGPIDIKSCPQCTGFSARSGARSKSEEVKPTRQNNMALRWQSND